jgi:aspartate aminotransferase
LLVLSDEIYGELEFDGHHRSIARHYPEGTIVASGLSKWCGAGGWRLGTFVFPTSYRWLLDAMATIASETYTSTSAPIQHAAVRAFQGGMEIERYLAGARRILSALTTRCANDLRDAGARVVSPRGAFYLFPDLPPSSNLRARRDVRTSDALCRRLLAELGVAALPGSVFGRPPTELTLRIATVDFDGAKALAALESMGLSAPVDDAFLNAHCHPVLAAVSSVARWLQEP